MAKYSKVGHGNYSDIDNAIEQGILDGRDLIVTKDTSELVYIKDDNTKQIIQARLKRFGTKEEALEKLNSASDTYDGQPVAIKNDSNCYQLYLVLNDGEKFIVNPVFDAGGVHVACDNKSLVTDSRGVMSIAGIKEAPVGAVPTKQEDESVQWVDVKDFVTDRIFSFTITPPDSGINAALSATRAEMLEALDAGKTLKGYWIESRTILHTTTEIKHEFSLVSVEGDGATRGLTFVNYEQFYKSTLYVNGNDTISFIDKECLPLPMNKTDAMTQVVGMDDDGRLWTAASNTVATKDTLGSIKVGDNLIITENGILSVDIADVAEADNTRPITSAAVNTIVGNIDALLSII